MGLRGVRVKNQGGRRSRLTGSGTSPVQSQPDPFGRLDGAEEPRVMRRTRLHEAHRLRQRGLDVPRQHGKGRVIAGVQPQDLREEISLSSLPGRAGVGVKPDHIMDVAPPQGTCLGDWQRFQGSEVVAVHVHGCGCEDAERRDERSRARREESEWWGVDGIYLKK